MESAVRRNTGEQSQPSRFCFTRREGESEVGQLLYGGKKQFVWKLDARGITVLDTIYGKWHRDNPSRMVSPGLIENGQMHTSVVSVRKNGVRAYFDGRLIFMYNEGFHGVGIEAVWKLKSPRAIGVAALDSVVDFHKIMVKEVSGPGVELPPPQMTQIKTPPLEPPPENKVKAAMPPKNDVF